MQPCEAKAFFVHLQIAEKGGNITSALRQLYQKHVLPFEEFSGGISSDIGGPSNDCAKRKRLLPVVAPAAQGNGGRVASGELEAHAADCLLEIRCSSEDWELPPAKRQRVDPPDAAVDVSPICAQVIAVSLMEFC